MATPLENDASRALRSLCDAYRQRDWEQFAARLSDEFFVDDRRKLIGGVTGDKRAFIGAWKTFDKQGYELFEVVDIATRGADLALQDSVASGSHGFTAEALPVTQTKAGRIIRVAIFDPEDLDAAFAELDERWIDGGEATEATKLLIAGADAYNTRDWTRAKSLLTDDFVYVDHRPVGFGILRGSEDYIRYAKATTAQAGDRRARMVAVFGEGPSQVTMWRQTGTSEFGAHVEWESVRVGVARGGKLSRWEIFPLDLLDDAITRASELSVK